MYRVFVFAGLLLAICSIVSADLPFQSLEERVHFSFSYPSGRARLASDPNTIKMFNRAWSDTTGKGIAPASYYSHLDKDGDSVGVWWWSNLSSGKYFFVETTGIDSLFAVPDYVRLGWDTIPPASIDSAAIIAGAIKTVHLDTDSIISAAHFIKSGVIANVHLTSGIDGMKLQSSSVPAERLEVDGISPNRVLDFTSATDSFKVEHLIVTDEALLTNVLAQPSGGPVTILGSLELDGSGSDIVVGGDVSIAGALTVTKNADFDSSVTLGDASSDAILIGGDLTVNKDMVLGDATTDTIGIHGVPTCHDSIAVGYSFDTAGADSDRVSLGIEGGFLKYVVGTKTVNMPSMDQDETFDFVGVKPSDYIIVFYTDVSLGHPLGVLAAECETVGTVRVKCATTSLTVIPLGLLVIRP